VIVSLLILIISQVNLNPEIQGGINRQTNEMLDVDFLAKSTDSTTALILLALGAFIEYTKWLDWIVLVITLANAFAKAL